MQLHIYPTKTIAELRAEFNSIFPYLNIECLASSKGNTLVVSSSGFANHNLTLGRCQAQIVDGVIEFDDNTTVREFEKIFKNDYKLNVQVFRKSGNIWLETTLTDQWVLSKQNQHGRELSEKVSLPVEDFDLNRGND